MLQTVQVLNFDDAITRQRRLLERVRPEVVDLRHLGPAARIWASQATANAIRSALPQSPRPTLTFLGSGDFHHVSSLLIERFQEPISVIVFDHHPDWDILPPRLHCGSWVTQVLRRSNVTKVILLGVSSNDLSSPRLQSGHLRSLLHDRVEIYPYAHAPTTTWLKRVPENRSCRVERGLGYRRIHWRELCREPLQAFVLSVLARLEARRVYVSIDKDCLAAEHSLTNWEAGRFSLEEVVSLLTLITQHTEIIGADIVGDYSPPHVRGWLRTLIANVDYPSEYSAKGIPESQVTSINERTNLRLLDVLLDESFQPPHSS